MAGTMKVSAKGVLLWCETKQNVGRLYSIRDWISTIALVIVRAEVRKWQFKE